MPSHSRWPATRWRWCSSIAVRREPDLRHYGERVPVYIDSDIREEYWTEIRKQPENKLGEIANR